MISVHYKMDNPRVVLALVRFSRDYVPRPYRQQVVSVFNEFLFPFDILTARAHAVLGQAYSRAALLTSHYDSRQQTCRKRTPS
jgi:hypothetical protein